MTTATLVAETAATTGCALTPWCDNDHGRLTHSDTWVMCCHLIAETGDCDSTLIAVSVQQEKPINGGRWTESCIGYSRPGKPTIEVYGADQSGCADLTLSPKQARAFAAVLRLTGENRWLADALVAAAEFTEVPR